MNKDKKFKTISDILKYIDEKLIISFYGDHPIKGRYAVAIWLSVFDVTPFVYESKNNGNITLRSLNGTSFEFDNRKLPLLGLVMNGLFSLAAKQLGSVSELAGSIHTEIYTFIDTKQFNDIVGDKDYQTFKEWMD